MRYNKRLKFITYEDGKFIHHDTIYCCNVTRMGYQAQQLVFGSIKQGRIAIRFQNPNRFRTGYFLIDGVKYQIESSTVSDHSSIMYGVEYHGRL